MRVHGVGNPNASIMFVGEAPGEEEDRRGIPFVGKAGKELDFWLDRTCRLSRSDVFISNMCRERPPGNRDPKPEEISRDLPDLWLEIAAVDPEIIVPLGAISTQYFLGDWASMALTHGLPHRASASFEGGGVAWEWSGAVLPIVHPAAGLHQSSQYALTVFGFEQLAKFLRGEIGHHEIDTAPVEYREWRDEGAEEFLRWAQNDWGYLDESLIAIDTEGSAADPWCLTFSVGDRSGGLIRTSQRQMLAAFRASLHHVDAVAMHYAPHDLRVLEAMGVDVDTRRLTVYDTMQLAYITGRLPQGLKALAYRLCGIRMREYEDLVRSANETLAAEYMAMLAEVYAPAHPKDKKHPVYKAVQRCLKSVRGPRALWADQNPEIREEALAAFGDMPVATLDDVEFSEVLSYACSDADATRRVFLEMRKGFD